MSSEVVCMFYMDDNGVTSIDLSGAWHPEGADKGSDSEVYIFDNYVIKAYQPKAYEAPGDCRARMRREAKRLATWSDAEATRSHIPILLSMGTVGSKPAFMMTRLGGMSLAGGNPRALNGIREAFVDGFGECKGPNGAVVAGRPLPAGILIEFARNAAECLGSFHAANRDLHGGNLLFQASSSIAGEAKATKRARLMAYGRGEEPGFIEWVGAIDFSRAGCLANGTNPGSPSPVVMGGLRGCFWVSAPEVYHIIGAREDPARDRMPVDWWSLGATLYSLRCGAGVWPFNTDDLQARYGDHKLGREQFCKEMYALKTGAIDYGRLPGLSSEFEDPRDLEFLCKIMRGLLEVDPDRRWGAHECLGAIEAYRASRRAGRGAGSWAGAGRATRTSTKTKPQAGNETQVEEKVKGGRLTKASIVVIAASLAIIAGATGLCSGVGPLDFLGANGSSASSETGYSAGSASGSGSANKDSSAVDADATGGSGDDNEDDSTASVSDDDGSATVSTAVEKIGSTTSTSTSIEGPAVYKNSRYGFSVYVPQFFASAGESANGDGASFAYSAEGAALEFSVSGMRNLTGETVESMHKKLAKGHDVSYEAEGDNWVVVSYVENSMEYYTKVYVGESAINTLSVQHHEKYHELGSDAVEELEKTFKHGDID